MSEKKRRVRRSLNKKAFIITLLLTLFIGVTVLIAGFAMYLRSIAHEYFVSTWNQANAEAAVLEQTEYRRICDEVLEIYDSIPEEKRGDGASEEYMAKFAGIRDDSFRAVQEAMRSLQSRNGPMNAFIVAFDNYSGKMLYMIDADPSEETTCKPGTWDDYPRDQIDTLIYGRDPSDLEKRQGIEHRVQAVYTNRPEYGRRVTAASTLYQTDDYTLMICVDENMQPMYESARIFLIQYIALLVSVTLIASLIGMKLMGRAMVRPINKMADAAVAYGHDQDKQSGTRYFNELNIRTDDEIEQLSDALRDMEDEVADYLYDLTRVTAEKERINTELSLAARIQMSMLTVVFPPFPDRNEFEIFASMEPAKEIGGDFYDMLLIDDDHLAIEIADVSGKGIPAALFMMASKIMLADGVNRSLSPAKVLEEVNDKISMNNEEEMFVTVWLGILELSTGRLTAANAGHEYPVVIRADGGVELIHDKHGFVIGGMEGMRYTDYELQLNRGDSIFVYTDGVTEATSTDSELFGTDRMLEGIGNAGRGAHPSEIMQSVRTAIREFTIGGEQFDDLTMLCLKYTGKDSSPESQG